MSIRLVFPVARFEDRGKLTGGQTGLDMGDHLHVARKEKAGNIALVTYEALELKRNRPRDVAALHEMQARRPLKPPPHDFGERRPVAALIAVRKDRKAGVLV